MERFYAVSLIASVLLLSAGCNSDDEYREFTDSDQEAGAHAHEAEHDHSAPHGGELIEIGDHQYNLELVLEGGVLTAYVLDAHAEGPVAIEQDALLIRAGDAQDAKQLALSAQPQDGDDEGRSSVFVAEILPEGVTDVHDLQGHIEIDINGEEFELELGDHHHGEGHAEHEDHEDNGHEADGHEEEHADEG